MSFEVFKKYGGENKYNKGILLNEWNGAYFLVSAGEWEGGVYKEWAHPSGRDKQPKTRQDGSYIALPWQVKLGEDKEEAIETLKWIAEQLGGDDIPF